MVLLLGWFDFDFDFDRKKSQLAGYASGLAVAGLLSTLSRRQNSELGLNDIRTCRPSFWEKKNSRLKMRFFSFVIPFLSLFLFSFYLLSGNAQKDKRMKSK